MRKKLHLVYIRDSINYVNEFVASGRDVLFTSELVRSAVMFKLQTLAESTQKLSDELKTTHPEIDWISIGGFRNRVAHGYMSIRLNIVWDVIQNYLPDLKIAVEAMIATLDESPTD